MVPGLKKMDKASVLGDAIIYLKALQDKVKVLEEQAAKRTVVTSVLVKRCRLSAVEDENDASSTDETHEGAAIDSGDSMSLPEIEVKLSEKSLLIKIHCDSRKGILVHALQEIEKLHLTVVSTSLMPFAASSLDITVMAQIEEGFCMTTKELVKKMSSVFRQLILLPPIVSKFSIIQKYKHNLFPGKLPECQFTSSLSMLNMSNACQE
ncbi:hypothetical protein HPP92_007616 [Vanilla planifolia]|uniref:BHLH domain-containing protein n=1 Tax=Vanilla planifolia TaxID=51239 RepID=A0A835RHW1_VANPL|nr:hypothetical protein HPP92_007616 [Vanilla planifolia]